LKKFAIIVAGGTGTRMQNVIPKQFIELCGKPILMHTIEKFYKSVANIQIIIALPNDHISTWSYLCSKYAFAIPHLTVKGGQTRYHSVKNALSLVTENSIIAVHDAVRPLVSNKVINNCFKLAQSQGNAIPVVSVKDSIRKIEDSTSIAVNRNNFKAVQTPQCFSNCIIQKAYLQEYKPEFTDDASVVEYSGVEIYLTEGNDENIKITTPLDLLIAESIMKNNFF